MLKTPGELNEGFRKYRGCGVKGLGFGVLGISDRVWGLWLRVWGGLLGFGVSAREPQPPHPHPKIPSKG